MDRRSLGHWVRSESEKMVDVSANRLLGMAATSDGAGQSLSVWLRLHFGNSARSWNRLDMVIGVPHSSRDRSIEKAFGCPRNEPRQH